MMCVLMRVRDADALARACDLGVAMQLTNIARDVGEDTRAGRIYLPLQWLEEAKMTPGDFMANPVASPAVRRMVKRLLAEARRLYVRSETGIGSLPLNARTGIFAARYIYAAIGTQVKRKDHDSINHRARTNNAHKMGLIGVSAASVVLPKSPVLFAAPLDEVRFLVGAVATNAPRSLAWGEGRTGALLSVLSELKSRETVGQGTIGVAAE